jgi:hypothetical protein
MFPLSRICLRLPRQRIPVPIYSRPIPVLPTQFRTAATLRKKKKAGIHIEKDADRRLRLKLKLRKELDKKKSKHQKWVSTLAARFKLPPHKPRPDAVPFASAMALLRGWGAKQAIFVNSKAAGWVGETKVVAQVRVVPNDHHPRGLKGKVKFPHPVVFGGGKKKKERIAVIVEGEDVEDAKKAGMIVGGKEYLAKVRTRWGNWELIVDCANSGGE